jgi:hypothetical protein
VYVIKAHGSFSRTERLLARPKVVQPVKGKKEKVDFVLEQAMKALGQQTFFNLGARWLWVAG